jgi:acetyl-CoA synthetase
MRHINERYVTEDYNADGQLVRFDINAPADFNFGYDIVDDIAVADPERRAMIWVNPEGEEHTFTFKDMKYWSDKTANYLASLGIGKGDKVLVILRRHYQFWFTAVALAKLGAIMVPATFMLKEHDMTYRLNEASIKAVICTNVGDIADVVDAVIDECPTVETLILAHGGGGGLSDYVLKNGEGIDAPRDAQGVELGAVLSGEEGICALGVSREGWHDFNTGVREASDTFTKIDTLAAEPMLMYFSSGTSGNPKMVLHNSLYALGHLITAKHWHNVRSDGIHFTIADTGWGKAVWGKMYGQWTMEA